MSKTNQICQDDQFYQDNSTNSSSATDGTAENNNTNNNIVAAGNFGPFTTAGGFFDVTSKTTVSNAINPFFPLSRKEADNVSNERTILFVDGIFRDIKGKNGLNVKVSLFIPETSSWLMYVHANCRRDVFGILYDTRTGKVSLSKQALSRICTKADTGIELDPNDVENMDKACLEFFATMRLQNNEEQESEGGEK